MQKVLIFTTNLATMRWIKLTASAALLFSFLMLIGSCQRDDETDKESIYSKKGIVMSGAQETPSNPTSATGTMDVSYDKGTKILTYSVTWSGLTGNAIAAHVHGLAPVGYAAPVVQTFSGLTSAPSGTYSSSLLIDGVAIREVDLLNGLYYINIHTATYPNGEIRGQIKFQ